MKAKRTALVVSMCGLFLLSACTDKEEVGDKTTQHDDVVVVNDSDDGETSEEEKTYTRKEYDDEVPTTDRDTNAKRASDKSGNTNHLYGEEGRPELSEEYIALKDTDLISRIGGDYILYTKDDKGRSVGGEGVVTKGTLKDEELNYLSEDESATKLYTYHLLETTLLKDERGEGSNNKVKVTKQMYNNLVELNQNIYKAVNDMDNNEVSVYVEALYYGDDEIPYGVIYEAKSTQGDINFFYQINNIQTGQSVNYQKGTIGDG